MTNKKAEMVVVVAVVAVAAGPAVALVAVVVVVAVSLPRTSKEGRMEGGMDGRKDGERARGHTDQREADSSSSIITKDL